MHIILHVSLLRNCRAHHGTRTLHPPCAINDGEITAPPHHRDQRQRRQPTTIIIIIINGDNSYCLTIITTNGDNSHCILAAVSSATARSSCQRRRRRCSSTIIARWCTPPRAASTKAGTRNRWAPWTARCAAPTTPPTSSSSAAAATAPRACARPHAKAAVALIGGNVLYLFIDDGGNRTALWESGRPLLSHHTQWRRARTRRARGSRREGETAARETDRESRETRDTQRPGPRDSAEQCHNFGTSMPCEDLSIQGFRLSHASHILTSLRGPHSRLNSRLCLGGAK